MKRFLCGAAVALCVASGQSPAYARSDDTIRRTLSAAIPTVKIESIRPSGVPGVKEVMLDGKIVYVSDDGRHLFQGHLVEIGSRRDLTEARVAESRRRALEELGFDRAIRFKPKIGRHAVWVFTDLDCGYCRKLHAEIDQYLAQGIEVRYLFYPRAGKDSDSYVKAVSVWCSEDRNAALTQAKQGRDPVKKTCEHPVDRHLALGDRFGMQGTPLIVTEHGTALPGYVPAAELTKRLSAEAARSAR